MPHPGTGAMWYQVPASKGIPRENEKNKSMVAFDTRDHAKVVEP